MAASDRRANEGHAWRTRFPWLALIVLLISAYVFWVLPVQFPPKPVSVEFDGTVRTGGSREQAQHR